MRESRGFLPSSFLLEGRGGRKFQRLDFGFDGRLELMLLRRGKRGQVRLCGKLFASERDVNTPEVSSSNVLCCWGKFRSCANVLEVRMGVERLAYKPFQSAFAVMFHPTRMVIVVRAVIMDMMSEIDGVISESVHLDLGEHNAAASIHPTSPYRYSIPTPNFSGGLSTLSTPSPALRAIDARRSGTPTSATVGTSAVSALPYRMLYAVVTMDTVTIYNVTGRQSILESRSLILSLV